MVLWNQQQSNNNTVDSSTTNNNNNKIIRSTGSITTTNTMSTLQTIHQQRLRRVGIQAVLYLMAGLFLYLPFIIIQTTIGLIFVHNPDNGLAYQK